MRNVTCEKCEGRFSLNDTIKIRESIVCSTCAESMLTKEKIPSDQIQHQIDPTICIGCGLDNGNSELPTLGQSPVCAKCETFFKNRPFPNWIKAALIGMVVLVVFTLVWNSRFIYAYCDLKSFESAMATGNIEQGMEYFISASNRVPENEELQAYGTFYKGILLLNQEKSEEALKLFQSCRGRIEDNESLDDLIIDAQIGIAFDKSDYDEFLRLAIQMNDKHKDDSTSTAQLASAFACKYVETQDEQYKIKSLETLEYAKKLANSRPEYKEYYAEYEPRILHRLHTRKIINRSEFYKRYPNGWTVESEEIQK